MYIDGDLNFAGGTEIFVIAGDMNNNVGLLSATG